jgi:hypothetical protein
MRPVRLTMLLVLGLLVLGLTASNNLSAGHHHHRHCCPSACAPCCGSVAPGCAPTGAAPGAVPPGGTNGAAVPAPAPPPPYDPTSSPASSGATQPAVPMHQPAPWTSEDQVQFEHFSSGATPQHSKELMDLLKSENRAERDNEFKELKQIEARAQKEAPQPSDKKK